MTRLFAPVLSLVAAALAVSSCASQLTLTGSSARTALISSTATPVRAVLSAGAAGTSIRIDNPGLLPTAVQTTQNLKAVVGGKSVTVTREAGGAFSFVLPAGTSPTLDVNGDLRVVFVMNDRDSQIVELATGSPVQFGTPPVTTDPNPGFIVQGLDVMLHANNQADLTQYQFTWSYSTNAAGPWQPIPGQGKDVKWTPPAPGNYFVKVDAVDRATQQQYSTTTSSAVVFVTDTKEVLTTEPTSGTVQRGNTVTLKFNRPNGLVGDNLSYAWSAGPSPQGPWSVVTGSGPTTTWLPTTTGSYYVKAEVSNKDTGTVNTFISANAIVFVAEGTPIVTPSQNSLQRGDRVGLTLNIANAGTGPYQWFYGLAGGASALGTTWTPINVGGTAGKQISQVVNEAGSYNYRVDFPDANGNIQSFVTTNPVVAVHEGQTPLITSDPGPTTTISQGGVATLILNARGVDENNYRYTWYYSTNPTFGWTAMPVQPNNDPTKKTFTWNTTTRTFAGTNAFVSNQAAGAYFIRVDATDKVGSTSYTFTSSTPVVTIQP